MKHWTEIRTAYRLAKLGTLSATAKDIGVHRSTVMRHIDVLEQQMQIKLFQRNDKGYLPTEAGLEVMRLGEITDLQFTQFINQTQNQEQGLSGQLSITCVAEAAQLLQPVISEYQQQNPKVQVNIIGDTRIFDLEYGEADIALRTGEKPQTLDNVVFPYSQFELTLCASKQYLAQHGEVTKDNMTQHHFLALNERLSHLPWNEWIYHTIPTEQIKLISSSAQALQYFLLSGHAIGVSTVDAVQQSSDLVALDLADNWFIDLWLLVHRDMLNIPKIRRFIDLSQQQDKSKVNLLL